MKASTKLKSVLLSGKTYEAVSKLSDKQLSTLSHACVVEELERAPKKCGVCGGTEVINNIECLQCYDDADGQYCGSDGCPSIGIVTEHRCRCDNPPAFLPVRDFMASV